MNKATWIWHYGDFEIHRNMLLSLQREERGRNIPVFWRIDDCHKNVCFKKTVFLEEEEEINVFMEGIGYVMLDGIRTYTPEKTLIGKGKHEIKISVANPDGLPSVYVRGKTVFSDGSWVSNCIGLTMSSCDGEFLPVGYGKFNDVHNPPSSFHLPLKEIEIKEISQIKDGYLVDVGEETFAMLCFENFPENSKVEICYGESIEEAIDPDEAYLIDNFVSDGNDKKLLPRAFRYIYIKSSIGFGNIRVFYEYMPMDDVSDFKCSDDELNKIYEVSKRTLNLCCREFFVDGIKRDKWIWAGDAYQSNLVNYYCFFNKSIVKKTIIALIGQEPVQTNINTILDYNFFWLSSIMEYYQYTGDIDFVMHIYPKMKSLIEFCLDRTDVDGLIEGKDGEWVFIDWSDMEKKGKLASIQMLFERGLESTAYCAKLCKKYDDEKKYRELAESLKNKINDIYWNKEKGAYVTSYKDNKISEEIVMHQNLLAVMYGIATDSQKECIRKNVLENPDIPEITTPYFRLYQLDTMCGFEKINKAITIMKKYWGGMLELGATSFWEEYNPDMSGIEHYSMYGDKYAKSLCHAWGAGPVYILGRYLLGIKPADVGYKSFTAEPELCGMDYIEGTVPTNEGKVYIRMDKEKLKILSTINSGTLILKSKISPDGNDTKVIRLSDNKFSIEIKAGKEYNISYIAID